MKVALFSSTIDVTNGYGNITYEYCRQLLEKGVQFTLFLPKNEAARAQPMNIGAIQCVLPPYIFRLKPWNILPYLRPVNVDGFDLVHSLFDFPYCWLAARAARKGRQPFLMGVQGTYGVTPLTYWPEKYLMKWTYRQARQVLVPSDFTRKKIEQYAGEHYPMAVIHNGVNFARFQKPVSASALDAAYAGKQVLLTVGGLRTRKGQDLVIRALAKIKDRYPDLVYIMVGHGYGKTELEQMARDNGVRDRIEFVGNKSGTELVAYFQRADIFILTPKIISDIVFEGFGIVYLEASACRKPIIATDAGGVRDAVVDEETGIIVPDQDVDGIARALGRLLEDKILAQKIGAAGWRYAQQHDWPLIANQYLDMYKKYV